MTTLRAPAADIHHAITRYRCQRSGTPFSSCSPASSNTSPAPGREVLDGLRHQHLGRRRLRADARTDVDGESRRTSPSTTCTSPVCTPARTSSPSRPVASTIACAHRTARAGPSNDAKKPSPAVSISVPRNRVSSARTVVVVPLDSSRHARSPSARQLRRRVRDVGEQHGGEHAVEVALLIVDAVEEALDRSGHRLGIAEVGTPMIGGKLDDSSERDHRRRRLDLLALALAPPGRAAGSGPPPTAARRARRCRRTQR